jgi:hypothetical protein
MLSSDYINKNKMIGNDHSSNEFKKPSKAFMLFCDGILEDYKEDFPKLSFKHLIQIISKEWKHLPSNEKQIFRIKANDLEVNYNFK